MNRMKEETRKRSEEYQAACWEAGTWVNKHSEELIKILFSFRWFALLSCQSSLFAKSLLKSITA